MMNTKVKIICTVGPASLKRDILKKFEVRNVSLARINLSHVPIEAIESYVLKLRDCKIQIAIDTEGRQVRTGYVGSGLILFHSNDIVKVHNHKVRVDPGNIYFTPLDVIGSFKPGDLIALDFNSVLLRVEDVSRLKSEDFIKCRVIIEGFIGSCKGVHCDSAAQLLPAFSEKDLYAVELAKKYNIKHFTLSFMDSAKDVRDFKHLYPEAFIYAKIETAQGLKNAELIMKYADGILIDRGDLSRYVPIESIPLAQKFLIEKANLLEKDVLVASNLLETMALELKPSRAEVNDIVNTVIDGVSGFVLTKETAVGKYPVETVNMMNSLIQQGELARSLSLKNSKIFRRPKLSLFADAQRHILDNHTKGLLIEPHGGKLVNLFSDNVTGKDSGYLPVLKVNGNALMDLEQIGIGTFSPLEGFLNRDDYKSVLEKSRLANGIPWTIPIILPVSSKEKSLFRIGDEIVIGSQTDNKIYGTLKVEDIYLFDKDDFAKKIYHTTDSRHPGIKDLKKCGNYLLGGKIKLLHRKHYEFSHLNLTPRQARSTFESLGWSRVVGFHTRNVIHRSHEYIQLEAMEKFGCDGLFVHPVAGKKKKGDYAIAPIIQSYEIMIEKYYPKNKVVFGVLSTYSRYAGPREAVFTALCRKNFGCSHFIVGRDHTGVGNFYKPGASHEIFDQIGDIGIEPIFFSEIGYSKKLKKYVSVDESKDEDLLNISGSQARRMIRQKEFIPKWFMYPEISRFLMKKLSRGEKVFIE